MMLKYNYHNVNTEVFMGKYVFGKLKNGADVNAFVIRGAGLEVTLLDYGATVQSIKYKGFDVALGYDTAAEYEADTCYFGATIGRVANRIKGGKFSLGRKTYNLSKNEGDVTLHGGQFGFNKFTWEVESYSDSEVRFKRLSLDGEEGFPGNVIVGVRYYVDGNTLGIEYVAVSDKDTVLNLTNHTYFNLNFSETVENMFLSINADYYNPIDKNLIPTGEVLPVKGTPMDFKWAKFIGKDLHEKNEQLELAKGYDHNYVLNGEGFREVAVLSSARNNIRMRCYTDRPAIQFYSGNFLDNEKGKRGLKYFKRAGVCLETQAFPNAVNESKFPSCELKKGEVFKSVTEYRFEDFNK